MAAVKALWTSGRLSLMRATFPRARRDRFVSFPRSSSAVSHIRKIPTL